MKRWLVAVGLVLGLAEGAQAQPVSGGLLGRGASFSGFVAPPGCVSSSVPFFGAAVTLGCDGGITYTAATGTLAVSIFKVGSGTDTSDPTFTTARTVSGTSGNAHAFSDTSTVTRSGGIGYNSFNAAPTFSGTADFNHFNSFQAVGTFSSSGTIDNWYGATSDLNVTSGTVTTRHGFRFVDAYVTGGSVGTQYGFECGAITSATTNYCFYSGGTTTASYHVGPLLLGGLTGVSHRLGILGGTLAADSSNKIIYGTQTFLAATTAAQESIRFTLTTAGSGAYQQIGHIVEMNSGYTGAAATVAAKYLNHAAGTAKALTNVGGGNLGNQIYVDGTTTGANIGGFGQTANGAWNFGYVGLAVTSKNGATNGGLVGLGLNGGTSPVQFGVYAGLTSASTPQVPTTSAALIANNGATSEPVARFQVNAVDTVVIGATAGDVTVLSLPTYADNTAALAGGLTAGRLYRTSTGVLMVTY